MAIPPIAPVPGAGKHPRIFGSARAVSLLALFALLILCFVFSWTTRDAMQNLSFLKNRNGGGGKVLVDLGPWQTAQALAPLAVTAEETAYARDAERLADHEVDQAFASALRMAALQTQHRTLTGEALALSQKVSQLKELIQQDQAFVDSLAAKIGPCGRKRGERSKLVAQVETICKSPRLSSGSIPMSSPMRSLIWNARQVTRARRFKVNLPHMKRRCANTTANRKAMARSQ